MTTYILIAATNKNTFFWQIHAQFLYFTYVCNQKRKKKIYYQRKRSQNQQKFFFSFFWIAHDKAQLKHKRRTPSLNKELGQERVRKCCYLNYVLYGSLWLYVSEIDNLLNRSNQCPIMLSMAHHAYMDLWEVEVISGFTEAKSINHYIHHSNKQKQSFLCDFGMLLFQ